MGGGEGGAKVGWMHPECALQLCPTSSQQGLQAHAGLAHQPRLEGEEGIRSNVSWGSGAPQATWPRPVPHPLALSDRSLLRKSDVDPKHNRLLPPVTDDLTCESGWEEGTLIEGHHCREEEGGGEGERRREEGRGTAHLNKTRT